MHRSPALIAVIVLAGGILAPLHADPGDEVIVTCRVTSSSTDSPITSPTPAILEVYCGEPASPVATKAEIVVPDVNGVFSMVLGDITPLDPAVFGDACEAEVTFDGVVQAPRIPIRAVPNALRAVEAEGIAAGADVGDLTSTGTFTATAFTDGTAAFQGGLLRHPAGPVPSNAVPGAEAVAVFFQPDVPVVLFAPAGSPCPVGMEGIGTGLPFSTPVPLDPSLSACQVPGAAP